MATIASKIQWTTAAFAVASAATLVPVAFADPTEPDTGDTAGAAVGSAAGQAPTRSTRKDRERVNDGAVDTQIGGSDTTAGGDTIGGATGDGAAGGTTQDRASTNVTAPSTGVKTPTANATPPLAVGDEVTIIDVPLVADPNLQAATFGWLKDVNLDVCVLGLSQSIRGSQSVVVGPYGTSALTFKTEGCG